MLGIFAGLIGLWTIIRIRRHDRFDPEPRRIILLSVILGALAMGLAVWVQSWLSRLAPDDALKPDLAGRAYFAAKAALTEEAAKLAVVIAMWRLIPRHFNEAIDGIMYGTFVGIGAALAETCFILFIAKEPIDLPTQEVMRILGHFIMGGIGGFAIGLFAQGHHRRWIIAPLCVFGACALHFMWDLLSYRMEDLPANEEDVRARLKGLSFVAMSLVISGTLAYHGLLEWGKRISAWHHNRPPNDPVRPHPLSEFFPLPRTPSVIPTRSTPGDAAAPPAPPSGTLKP